MRRLVFFDGSTPPVQNSEVRLCDDTAMISTGVGKQRADTIVAGNTYRFADGSLRSVGRVDQSDDDGATWTEV